MKVNKKIVTVMYLIIAVLVNVLVGAAETPPKPFPVQGLPVQGEDVLREYATRSVTRAECYVFSPSIIPFKGDKTWVQVTGNGLEEVMAKVSDTEFVYRLANPKDSISGRLRLYDDQNTLLFYGTAEYVPVVEEPFYEIWMQDIPLLSGVSSAEVFVRGNSGATIGDPMKLDIGNGKVMFRPYMAGATNAFMVVRFLDGTSSNYELSNPVAKDLQTVKEKASWNLPGHFVMTVGKPNMSRDVRAYANYYLPTVHLTVLSSGPVIFGVDAWIQAENRSDLLVPERAEQIIITREDGTVVFAPSFSDSDTVIDLDKGVYRVRFKFPTFGRDNKLYPYYENDEYGGKGMPASF